MIFILKLLAINLVISVLLLFHGPFPALRDVLLAYFRSLRQKRSGIF